MEHFTTAKIKYTKITETGETEEIHDGAGAGAMSFDSLSHTFVSIIIFASIAFPSFNNLLIYIN